jgi:hypothetical protein
MAFADLDVAFTEEGEEGFRVLSLEADPGG